MRKLLLAACVAGSLLGLGGCSQAQVDRAVSASAEAQVWVERAEAAVATAEALAVELHNEKATAAVASAREGLALAQGAAAQASAAAAAAKSAHDAGGGLVNILLAIGGTLVPALGAFAVAINRGTTWKQAAVQTVAGLQSVRKANPAGWDDVAKHLATAQDAAVKSKIKTLTG
jgi:hypothetical protein